MARIGNTTLARMLHRAAVSSDAGVDALTIWQKEAAQGSAAHKLQMSRVYQGLASGDGLAESMKACDGYFPGLAIDLIDVGEHTGRLEHVMRGLAEHYEHLVKLRNAFLFGIAWPGLSLFVATCIVGFMIWIMGVIGGGPGREPIDITGLGWSGTSGLLKYMFTVAFVVTLCTLGVMSVLRGWLGPKPMEIAMKIPVLGSCLKMSALSRLAWTLSLALNSGLEARRSIRMALRGTQNPYYTSQMEFVDVAIVEGKEFHEALRGTGLFPDEFLHEMETSELAGTQAESLERLANTYRERAKMAAKGLTAAATIAVWALVFAVVIFLIFRFAMIYIGSIYDALEPI